MPILPARVGPGRLGMAAPVMLPLPVRTLLLADWRHRIGGRTDYRRISARCAEDQARALVVELRRTDPDVVYTVRRRRDRYHVAAMERDARTIRPPPGLPPVADVLDPEHGPTETPCSHLAVGDEAVIGAELERWHVDEDGWYVTPRGRIGVREAHRVMMRRGARVMRLVQGWGDPDLVREHPGAPLRPEGGG